MLWKTGSTKKFIHFRAQLRNFAEHMGGTGLRFTAPARPGTVPMTSDFV